ncbi:MAG TPA: glycosyltransferase [Bryobacteraceae bacterium]|nr:glycosyltransferase [Bryobacteraceae bacterium]
MRVITRLNIGGPAIHTLLLTREMAALEYRTLLVAGSCEPDDGDMRCLLQAADTVYWVPDLSRSVHPWRNLKALWQLWRLLRRERPAIVHTHTAMAGCLGRLAAVLSGAPIVIHTFHGNSLDGYFSRIQAGAFRRVEQLMARFTDALCVVSPQQATELSAKFRVAPAHKFRVVPLGLELDDYFALRPPADSGPLTVGWFGRMVPVKNIALLAATVEDVLQRSQDIRFVIAGDGPDRAALTALLDRYGGRVEWMGWQKELLPAMARCDVVLQTSRNEGTPVALIQGMAAARPFVSTAVGGVVDMVSGSAARATGGARWYANGVLTECNAGTLADALVALADDRTLVTRMGLAGRAFAARQYRKETLVANLDALYRGLLQKKHLGQIFLGRNS